MKNLPEKIYLNLGIDDDIEDYDFKDLREVSWCEDQINKTDPCYVREDVFYKKLFSKLINIQKGHLTIRDYITQVKNKLP